MMDLSDPDLEMVEVQTGGHTRQRMRPHDRRPGPSPGVGAAAALASGLVVLFIVLSRAPNTQVDESAHPTVMDGAPQPSITGGGPVTSGALRDTDASEDAELLGAATVDPRAGQSDRLYEECLLAKGFDPEGVQVVLDASGRPWWVKTGKDVPAELHGPCLAAIGGDPDGLPSWGSLGRPPEDCRPLIGPEPWIVLFEPNAADRCVIVAEHQNVQIVNKGFDGLTVEWIDDTHRLRLYPDERFETGAIGSLLRAGSTEIDSSPYRMPTIWLLPIAASPTAGLLRSKNSLGPAVTGMTLGKASELLKLPIQVDADILAEPACLGAVIVDDPYSPIFVVSVEKDQAKSTILSIDDELTENPCP